MKRTQIRKKIFILLYQTNFYNDEEMEAMYDEIRKKHSVKDSDYIISKTKKVIEKFDEIDNLINTHAKNWKTSRMPKVDLAILRLGIFELMFDDDIPDAVALNEAINLAKEYGLEDSSKFIHAVLAKVIK